MAPAIKERVASTTKATHMAHIMNETKEFGGEARQRSWQQAVRRGIRKKCPQCGHGALFAGYSKTTAYCSHCGLDLSGHEANDAPPYITILLVGHVMIPLALAVKQLFDPPLWGQFAIWLPLILTASFLILPMAKGAVVGLQWANRMHGFAGAEATHNYDA